MCSAEAVSVDVGLVTRSARATACSATESAVEYSPSASLMVASSIMSNAT
jgi:hypothetical protein